MCRWAIHRRAVAVRRENLTRRCPRAAAVSVAQQFPRATIPSAAHVWRMATGSRQLCRLMPRYGVFGFTIESTVEFPELEQAGTGDQVDWRICAVQGECPGFAAASLGIDSVYGDVHVRTYASETTFRMAFDDTGVFDVHRARREIVWYPGPFPTEAAVRADVLGRVMALAAHADGYLTLHASAVSIAGR